MIQSIEQPSHDLQLGINQVRAGGAILVHYFGQPIDALNIQDKDDRIRSPVTMADIDSSNTIVGNIGRLTGEKTITEEYERTARELVRFVAGYDEDGVWCLDPADGTKNFIEGMLLNPNLDPTMAPRISLATVCLGKIINGQPRVGALLSPLLAGSDRLYAAEEGMGAFSEIDGIKKPLKVDPSLNEGIILVSENDHEHIDRIDRAKGIKVMRLGGLAFKILCALDQGLIHAYEPRLTKEQKAMLRDLPILGLASPSAGLHDYAAATVVGKESGAVVSAVDGNPNVKTGPGEHGILVANNIRNHGIMVDAMRA